MADKARAYTDLSCNPRVLPLRKATTLRMRSGLFECSYVHVHPGQVPVRRHQQAAAGHRRVACVGIKHSDDVPPQDRVAHCRE